MQAYESVINNRSTYSDDIVCGTPEAYERDKVPPSISSASFCKNKEHIYTQLKACLQFYMQGISVSDKINIISSFFFFFPFPKVANTVV